MMEEKTVSAPDGDVLDEELFSWTIYPAQASPGKAALVAVIIVALSFGSSWYAGKALGVVAFLLLGGSLWPFFVPTTYRFSTWGVEQRRWPTKQRKPWTYFRRYQVDRKGILLSPFISPSRLDPFRGMYLLAGKFSQEVQEVAAAQLERGEEKSQT